MKIIEGRIKISHIGSVPIRYIVKKECGKVIAITNVHMRNGFIYAIENEHIWLCLTSMPKKVRDRLKMQNTYKAFATLDPSDTWDEKEGLKVATQKLKAKLEAAIEKKESALKQYLHNMTDAI